MNYMNTIYQCSEDGEIKILTKGDNNAGDDRAGMIYAPNQKWVSKNEVIGRARGSVQLLLVKNLKSFMTCKNIHDLYCMCTCAYYGVVVYVFVGMVVVYFVFVQIFTICWHGYHIDE